MSPRWPPPGPRLARGCDLCRRPSPSDGSTKTSLRMPLPAVLFPAACLGAEATGAAALPD